MRQARRAVRRAGHPARRGPGSPSPTAAPACTDVARPHPAVPRRRACRSGPQLSPRTVDFRINWDSSMMFMPMVEGWHRVIQAQGADAKRSLLDDPEWRTVARTEWDNIDEVDVPEHTGRASCGSSRCTTPTTRSGSASRSPTSSPPAAVTRPTCSPTSCSTTTASPASSCGASPTTTPTRWRRSARRQRRHQLVGCGRARADAVRLGRHHAAAHASRARTRRLHPGTGDPRAHRPPGRRRSASTTVASSPGRAADLVVFALDELHWDVDEFVADLPGGAMRFRRPEGGYRATVVERRARAARRRAHRQRCPGRSSTSTTDHTNRLNSPPRTPRRPGSARWGWRRA